MAKRIYKPCIMHADGTCFRDTACATISGALHTINRWLSANEQFKNGTHPNQQIVDDWSPIIETWVENKETGEITNEQKHTSWK